MACGVIKTFSIRKLKDKLWDEFSLFIKIRDLSKGCISCGKRFSRICKDWQAGHYYTMGASYASIAYDEMNVNGQCSICNLNEGEKQKYARGLIRRYGPNALELIELKRATSSKNVWSAFHYQVLIEQYKLKNKEARVS